MCVKNLYWFPLKHNSVQESVMKRDRKTYKTVIKHAEFNFFSMKTF